MSKMIWPGKAIANFQSDKSVKINLRHNEVNYLLAAE